MPCKYCMRSSQTLIGVPFDDQLLYVQFCGISGHSKRQSLQAFEEWMSAMVEYNLMVWNSYKND